MFRWVLTVILLILSLVVASVILTITGVIHPQDKLITYAKSISWLAPYIETYYIGLESEQWSEQEQEKIDYAWVEINQKEQELAEEKQKLRDLEDRLTRQEQALIDKENKSQSAANLAALYGKMQPEEAVDILVLMDRNLVLDIILAMDDEMAADILVSLPSDFAAELSSQFH